MKKKIVIGLSLFSLLFLIGGMYIVVTIEKATTTLDNLIKLHQVEILREHLLIQVKKVQADLTLKNTRHARGIDTIVSHVRGMEGVARMCFSCHHTEEVNTRLRELEDQVEQYKAALSRVFTMRANNSRLQAEEDHAFATGEALIAKTNTMITMASTKLEEKTQATLSKIASTKGILYVLIAIGPFLAAGLAFIFVRGLTEPVKVLLEATRRLEAGDLDYRIEGLKDEFGKVATSFNDMAGTLKGNMETIEESEKRYRMLFESAGDAIFILEAEGERPGQIVAANRAAAEMHGYSVDELLALTIADLDGPDDAGMVERRIGRILGGEWIKDEIMHRKRDGSLFPVEVSAGLLELKDHKYVLAFDRDITVRKQAEERLQRAEQMKACGEFAAGLAHEIKNPLAGIKVSMEVLAEEPTVAEADRDVLLKVVEEIRRIELLLKDLLNFAKPPKPHLMSSDINALLDTTITFSMKSPSFSKSGVPSIRIVKELDPLVPETLADSMQLKQVFLNLLLNAADAMPEGGTLTVRTSYVPAGEMILVEIADTGKGVSEEIKAKIFQPFFTTKAKGTGLGLAISKRLVEQHGGTIAVDDAAGGGARFTITLPVRQTEEL